MGKPQWIEPCVSLGSWHIEFVSKGSEYNREGVHIGSEIDDREDSICGVPYKLEGDIFEIPSKSCYYVAKMLTQKGFSLIGDLKDKYTDGVVTVILDDRGKRGYGSGIFIDRDFDKCSKCPVTLPFPFNAAQMFEILIYIRMVSCGDIDERAIRNYMSGGFHKFDHQELARYGVFI